MEGDKYDCDEIIYTLYPQKIMISNLQNYFTK